LPLDRVDPAATRNRLKPNCTLTRSIFVVSIIEERFLDAEVFSKLDAILRNSKLPAVFTCGDEVRRV